MRTVGQVHVSDAAYFSGCLRCPECGDTKFGTQRTPDGKLIRHCHGSVDDDNSCVFQWPEEDDHLYFYLPLNFVLSAIDAI